MTTARSQQIDLSARSVICRRFAYEMWVSLISHDINGRYRRTGTLWEGRFKAGLVDSDRYLLVCMRYIELNPVRAGMTNHPADYRWSSYAANAYGNEDVCITAHPLYLGLGDDCNGRCAVYRGLFSGQIDDHHLHAIRETLNQELVLGSDYFKTKIATITKRRLEPGKAGRPRIAEKWGDYCVY